MSIETGQKFWNKFDEVRDSESYVVGITAIILFIFPWLIVRSPVISDILNGYQGLASLILIWGVFAIGFDLLLGYTGLLSFGHALFWGGAAYAAGLFSGAVAGSPILMVIAGGVFAILTAWIIGFLSIRRGGIYFAILTLAFGQMAYFLSLSPLAQLMTVNGSSFTGGEDGFTGVEVSNLLGVFNLDSSLPAPLQPLLGTWLYLFVAVITVICVAVAYRILNSPYGLVFEAIKENESRAKFVGLNVWRYKLMSFIISAGFAGIAGGMFVVYQSYVPLNSLYWTASGDIVVMTVLGGTNTLFGPIVGSGIYLYVKNVISGAYWHLILGVIFVVVVAFFKGGVWGVLRWIGGFIRKLTDGGA